MQLFHTQYSTKVTFDSAVKAAPGLELILVFSGNKRQLIAYFEVLKEVYTSHFVIESALFHNSDKFHDLQQAGVPLVLIRPVPVWSSAIGKDPPQQQQPGMNVEHFASRHVAVLGEALGPRTETDRVAPRLYARLAEEEDTSLCPGDVHARNEKLWIRFLTGRLNAPYNTGRLDGKVQENCRALLQPVFDLCAARYPHAVAAAYAKAGVLYFTLEGNWDVDVDDILFHLKNGAFESERPELTADMPANKGPRGLEAYRLIKDAADAHARAS